jgi:hypothetical protein
MRTFLASILGIAVSFIIVFLVEMISMNLFPIRMKIDPKNIEALRSMINNIPLPALITIIIGHGLGMFLGTFAANKVQPKSLTPMLMIFLLMLIATISNLAMIPHPIWFMIADVGIVILAALSAWKFLKWE